MVYMLFYFGNGILNDLCYLDMSCVTHMRQIT